MASPTARPPLSKTYSSQSGGSANDQHPLRHGHTVTRQRHAKVAPRTVNSARNLVKMGRQAQAQHANQLAAAQDADDGRNHARHRSHEGDKEIRLPGSLDDRPTIKRNMTSHDLPRNKSNLKLKKNLSHGHLTRLTHKAPPSPALRAKGKRPKSAEAEPQDEDPHEQEMEIYRQMQAKAQPPKKVGFAVGSAGDTSDDGEMVQAGASGPPEDEWTEGSASASPYSTRQNTANNSRRSSVYVDKPPDRPVVTPTYAAPNLPPSNTKSNINQTLPKTEALTSLASSEDGDEELSPRSQTRYMNPDNSSSRETIKGHHKGQHQHSPQVSPSSSPQPSPQQRLPLQQSNHRTTSPEQNVHPHSPDHGSPDSQSPAKHMLEQHSPEQHSPQHSPPHQSPLQQPLQKAAIRNTMPAAKGRPNPTLKRFVSHQFPAPALVSSISALDNMHSNRGSPAPSIRSSRSNIGGDGAMDREQEDELVSRFIPSASHPGTGSGGNTGAMNTPKQGSFHTPDEESNMRRTTGFHAGPASPGSTISGSSGAATPALGRSRIELRMLHDKALADREAAAERERRPLVPNHHYDRRNETLKSYLNLAGMNNDSRSSMTLATLSLGPEIFQGRFKAVNTELKVVQKFRDPISEAVERLRRCKGTKLSDKRTSPQKQQAAALKTSKSAVNMPVRGITRVGSKLSTSASPPKNPVVEMAKSDSPKKALPSSSSGKQIAKAPPGVGARAPRRGVSFAGTPPETREYERSEDERNPDAIARSMWDGMGV